MDGRRAIGSLIVAGLMAGAAAAQPLTTFDILRTSANDRPVQLPPLLAVPPDGPPPAPAAPPRGPVGEYDHRLFYLPEQAPERPPVSTACGPEGRFWIAPALELGWTKTARLPAILRSGSATGPAIFGGDALDSPFRAGFGLTGGFWFDPDRTRGLDASYYFLSEAGDETVIFSNGGPLILTTAAGGFPLADPAAGRAGSLEAGLSTRFSSADVNCRHNLLCTPAARLDALAGYRYLHAADDLMIFGKRIGPGGEIVRFWDRARSANDFHGGQIGLAGEVRLDRWFVGAIGKVAFGKTFTDTDLEGKFRVNGTVIPSGFFSRPDVAGERDDSHYAVVPAVGVKVGRAIGDHARAFVGYNFLYLSRAVRGPDAIDPAPTLLAIDPLNTTSLRARPNQRDAATSDIWAQSMSFGVEWRY
jgi:hypothetical protein